MTFSVFKSVPSNILSSRSVMMDVLVLITFIKYLDHYCNDRCIECNTFNQSVTFLPKKHAVNIDIKTRATI